MSDGGNKIIYPEISYAINCILFAVHNELGRYCNEKQICDRIEIYLKQKNILYRREVVLDQSFDGEMKGRNRIDFIIGNTIILEIKTVDFLSKDHYFQLRRYLQAGNLKLGILVNFREKRLHPRRILNSNQVQRK